MDSTARKYRRRIDLRCTEEEEAILETVCKHFKRQRSELIRAALRFYLVEALGVTLEETEDGEAEEG